MLPDRDNQNVTPPRISSGGPELGFKMTSDLPVVVPQRPIAQHLKKYVPLRSIRVSLADIQNIFEKFRGQVNEQAEIEISQVVRQPNQTEEQFETVKKNARQRAFKVLVTISGRDGQSITGDDASVLSASNRPDKVSQIFMSNVVAYQSFANVRPVNAFDLTLDFSKPPLIDTNNPVSSPT